MKEVPTVNNAELTLTEALTKPVIVVLPAANVVIPETAPEKDPVLADNTNLPILLPNNIVLEVGTIAVVLATNPVVVKLAELTRLV